MGEEKGWPPPTTFIDWNNAQYMHWQLSLPKETGGFCCSCWGSSTSRKIWPTDLNSDHTNECKISSPVNYYWGLWRHHNKFPRVFWRARAPLYKLKKKKKRAKKDQEKKKEKIQVQTKDHTWKRRIHEHPSLLQRGRTYTKLTPNQGSGFLIPCHRSISHNKGSRLWEYSIPWVSFHHGYRLSGIP